MAGQALDNLNVSFGADFKELLREMQRADRETSAWRKRVSGEMDKAAATYNKAGETIRNSIMSIASVMGLSRMADMARDTLKQAEALQQSSKWLGINAERLQAWEYGARQAGIEQGKLTQALDKMRGNLADAAADPNSGPAKIFQQIGISLRDLRTGELKNMETIIPQLAEKISKLSMADKLIVGKTLFGDKNDDIIRFLEGGPNAIKRIEIAAREAGAVWSTEFIDKNAQLNRDIEGLETKIGKDLKKAVVDFAPAWKLALEAVVEVQLAVDRLLSSIRIGGARLGKEPDARTRLGEIEKDMATNRAKLGPQTGGTPFDRTRRLSGTERAALESDYKKMAAERASILDKVNDENAEKQLKATYNEQDYLTSGITVNTRPGNKIKTGGASTETELVKKLRELRETAAEARVELEKGPQSAAWAKFETDIKRLGATQPQVNAAQKEFFDQLNSKGLIALKQFSEETDHIARIAQAEIEGRKELAAQLEFEFQLRQKYGKAFVDANKAQIDAFAAQRFRVEENRRLMQVGIAELEAIGRSTFEGIGAALMDFGNTNETIAERMRKVWINTLNQIINKIMELGVINPILNNLLGGNRDTLGGILGAVFNIGAGALGGGGGALGDVFSGAGSVPLNLLGYNAQGAQNVSGPMWVGEAGKELWVPPMPGGTILPNSRLSAGRGSRSGSSQPVIYYTIDARGSNGDAAVEAAVMRGLAKAQPTFTKNAVDAVRVKANSDPAYLPR